MYSPLLSLALAAPQQFAPFPVDSLAPALIHGSSKEFAPGRLIVRFPSPAVAAAFCAEQGAGVALGRCLVPSLNVYLVHLPADADVLALRDDWNRRPGVMYAMEDGVCRVRHTPNDPLYPDQIHLHNTGQLGGLPDADIDAPEAWDITRGSREFVVAIVDNGGDHDHVDLIANRWENPEELSGAPGIDDDENGFIDDEVGWNSNQHNGVIPALNHGTRVAGIVGARGNNGLIGSGVSPVCSLLYVHMGFSPAWPGQFFYSEVAPAFDYVYRQKRNWRVSGGLIGANVVAVTACWGTSEQCDQYPYILWNDLFEMVGEEGVLTIGASLDASPSAPYNVDLFGDVPSGCASETLISVTSTDRADVLSGAHGAIHIDLAAPGDGIVAPIIGGPGADYDVTTATSWAAATVAGAVHLMHSASSQGFRDLYAADPRLGALALKQMMLDSVDPLPGLAGITVSGGRLNLRRALETIAAYDSLGLENCFPQVANSAGQFGRTSAQGSLFVSDNDLTLHATGVPPNQFGYFLVGTGTNQTPFSGSQGIRCVGGSVGRYNLFGQLQNSGTAGTFVQTIDLTGMQVNPVQAVQVGETWHFQAWYRDQNPLPTSNSTSGLRILFL
ncbi:MAG: S8 family serine peptidase [Planctomycetota bacterium]